MALTSVANSSAGTLTQAGQQKNAEAVQAKEKRSQPAEASRLPGKAGDTVTLSQAEKISVPAASPGENQVDDVLPRAKAAILQNSKAAVSSQANVNAQTAREILTEA